MNEKRKTFPLVLAVTLVTVFGCGQVPAAEPRAVPPNMIGLILTPTGFDGKIYEPGQVDIGGESWSGYGNKLYLLQRSGFDIKEQFGRNDPNNANDIEDHRCIVGAKRQPMTLDVRLLFALPNYKEQAGKEAILHMGLLGNPREYGNRVMLLDAGTVYFQQVQQKVRGKIRDVCLGYDDVEAVYKAIEKNGTSEGFSDHVLRAVATVLAEERSPLFLVGAVVSNVKPDQSVVDAIAAAQAAEVLVTAMETIDTFIQEDPTGMRAHIYKLMMLKDVAARAGASGGTNTLFMTDVSGGSSVVPLSKK